MKGTQTRTTDMLITYNDRHAKTLNGTNRPECLLVLLLHRLALVLIANDFPSEIVEKLNTSNNLQVTSTIAAIFTTMIAKTCSNTYPF